MKDVAAAGLARNDPAAHERQIKDGDNQGSRTKARCDQRQNAPNMRQLGIKPAQ